MTIEFTPKQQQLVNAVFDDNYRFILYGGAIRGGKTYGALAVIIWLALRYPGSRWVVVRKDLPTIKRNVIETFNRVRRDAEITELVPEVNQSSWTSAMPNDSKILFFAENWERDKELNRWRGLETNGFYLDEVNELQEAAFEKAMERLGSWVMPEGNRPPSVILMSANPCRNWVKEQIYDKNKAGELKHPWLYIPATPLDNPHLPEEYHDNLLALREKNPISYARHVEGDWDISDGDYFTRDLFKFHSEDERESTLGFFADIAYTRKKTSDYCSFGLAGVDRVGTKRWFETKIERMDTAESTEYILRKAREYDSRQLKVPFWIEANDAYMELLKQRSKVEGVKLLLHQLKPGGQAKADRIQATKMGMNLWEFDKGSQQLINQFLDWSPELEGVVPDDGPDMHAYADVTLKWDERQVSSWNKFHPRNAPKDEMARKVWKAMQKRQKKTRDEPMSF